MNNLEVDQLVNFLAKELRMDASITEEAVLVKAGEKELKTPLSVIRAASELMKQCQFQETTLFSPLSYEVAVGLEGRAAMRPLGDLEARDEENGLSYKIGEPSPQYVLSILSKILAQSVPPPPWIRHRLAFLAERSDSVLHLISRAYSLRTLRVESSRSRTKSFLEKSALAYLFSLGYNSDLALTEIRSLDAVLRSERLSSVRRRGSSEVDAPRRLYIPDLVYHYQQGIAAESAVLQFLSFYHVLEHHFESIYTDETARVLQERLTSPNFSYKKRHDVMDLVKLVEQRIRLRNEEYQINEREALYLTINKLGSVETLKERIGAFDARLLDHYRKPVHFSDGSPVEFDALPQDVAKALAGRIYPNRNAIVHSKDGTKAKFVPYHHDKFLLKEVPLVRFLAEDVIVKTSTILD